MDATRVRRDRAMIPWARDDWLGADKLEHGALSFLLWGWLLAAGCALPVALTLFSVAAWGIEALEWRRYVRWERRGRPAPWPYLCDQPSWRDLVWDYAGAALSALALAVLA